MYNIGYKVLRNLALPKDEEPKVDTGNGLLARNVPSKKQPKELSINEKVASYVAEIRKAREGLKNG
jgi:hypothetical protein